ncbi:hypothetical protein, partial [Streptococcus pneumoniae]|uniref:hypothetical protein n=1 Tax=Streptococcus pneumoniae TaxID=1313 RepID=UPI00067C1852
FLMSCFVAFHYRSYGTFFLHKIVSIISIGDLPTTNIIEPKKNLEGATLQGFILLENLFKPRQLYSATSKHCFEQPAASFLVCSLIFIEY